MSVDAKPGASPDPPADVDCALCAASLDPDDYLVVQCYPESGEVLPERAAADGFLGVCADCAADVDELLDAWSARDEPPVGPDAAIAAGYRRVADECSFCDRPLGTDPLVGVEYVPDGGDQRERASDYANYSLCADCAPVFDEFLDGVGGA